MSAALHQLLQDKKLWHARQVQASDQFGERSGISTGLPALDNKLPNQGWPRSGLVEVLHDADGIGELRLLFPLLAKLSQSQALLLVAPPFLPYASGWQQQGVRLQNLHLLHCADGDAAWAAERALRAGCCGLVLSWLHRSCDKTLRRLQLAAEHGHSLGVLMRDRKHQHSASPAILRVALESQREQALLRVVKARGLMPQTALTLPAYSA